MTHPLEAESIFEGVDVPLTPRFSVGETAKFYFGRSAQWLRQQEAKLPQYGQTAKPHRNDSNARFYSLKDVEDIARALTATYVIEGQELFCIRTILYVQAKLYGILPENLFVTFEYA